MLIMHETISYYQEEKTHHHSFLILISSNKICICFINFFSVFSNLFSTRVNILDSFFGGSGIPTRFLSSSEINGTLSGSPLFVSSISLILFLVSSIEIG